MTAPAGRPAVEPAPGGVRVHLRVAPKASRDAVAGIMRDGDGRDRIKLSVTAVPEDGKANAAVVRLLAKAWALPKSSIDIVAGGADRSKVLLVAGETGDLLARLGAWVDGLPRTN